MANPVGRCEWQSPELHDHQLDLAGGHPSRFAIPDARLREAVDKWWAHRGPASIAFPSVAGTAGFEPDPEVDDGTMLHRRLFLTVFQVDRVASLVLEAQPVRVERDESGRVSTPGFGEQAFVAVAFEGLLSWASLTQQNNFFLRSSDLPRAFVGAGHDFQTLAIDPAKLADPEVRRALRRNSSFE